MQEALGRAGYTKRALSKNRGTREKELQAWLIKNAINNKGLYFDATIQFLTSELTLYYNDGEKSNKKITTDILGIDQQQNLVIIELKSLREKKGWSRKLMNLKKLSIKMSRPSMSLLKFWKRNGLGKLEK